MAEPGIQCSTCGARSPKGRLRCETCGTPLRAAAHSLTSPTAHGMYPQGTPLVDSCPRCGYQGEGIPYFSRGRHVAALVGATAVTAGALGAGGLIYYVVRREHVICPRCGESWGKEGQRAVARPAKAGDLTRPDLTAVTSEGPYNKMSIFSFVLAAIFVMVGILAPAVEPLVIAAFAAGSGAILREVGKRKREERRNALVAALQQPVLRLASANQGRLTVTKVAAELGWTLPRAEKVLQSLDDGWRVTSEVTNDGVIVYEFRELMLMREALPPDPGSNEFNEPRADDPADDAQTG